MEFLAAPLQGYTEAPWRRFHAQVYGPAAVDRYFTPFVRLDGDGPRRRDMRDIAPEPASPPSVAQIIVRSADEFVALSEAVAAAGYSEIDINMGCPFVPQLRKGRGAAFMLNLPELRKVSELINASAGRITYSVKMRLGVDSPGQWRPALELLNATRLGRLTVHPRTARQAYSGELQLDEFAGLLAQAAMPVVFNGGMLRPADVDDVVRRYPAIAGVMVGRGLLGRPSLASEWREGCEWDRPKRIAAMLELHSRVAAQLEATLCGDAQVLTKLKPFWDYAEEEIGRRAAKALRKASTMRAYREAVGAVG